LAPSPSSITPASHADADDRCELLPIYVGFT
jgi:hypothetical protein